MSVQTYFTVLPSPIGELLLTGADDAAGQFAISGLFMTGQRYEPMLRPEWIRDANRFADAQKQLDAYFAGDLTEFDLPLAASGSEFQRSVWTALRESRWARPAVRADRRGCGRPVEDASGRSGDRPQPDRHRGSVPSRHRRRRLAHRLRRRPRSQALVARPRGTDVRRAAHIERGVLAYRTQRLGASRLARWLDKWALRASWRRCR